VLTDCVSRLLEGVLPEDTVWQEESHSDGLLECPHYTKPAEWRGRTVPEVLVSGHHANIERWRRQEALKKTLETRPELLEHSELTEADRAYLDEISRERS
jgi:tRNA (guanine37-N1)-methyltransferase